MARLSSVCAVRGLATLLHGKFVMNCFDCLLAHVGTWHIHPFDVLPLRIA